MKDEDKTKEHLIQELVELRHWVAELENYGIKHKREKEVLRESEERYQHIFEHSPIGIGIASLDGKVITCNKTMEAITGYSLEELKKINLVRTYENPDDREALVETISRHGGVVDFPVRLKHKDGTPYEALLSISRINLGAKVFFHTIAKDVTERKRAEEMLKKAHEELEQMVAERTAELREVNEELKAKTSTLEEVNTALRVLLKRRDEDKTELEEKVLANVKQLVLPFLEKLEKSPLDTKQLAFLHILESNLNAIISPFLRTLSTRYVSLTAKEIQVANLIKEGKKTREIGEVMTLSPRTIETHRKNIRKKLGIEKKRGNLRSHLVTLQ